MVVSSFPQLKLDLLSIFGDCITDETLCCCYTSENNWIWFTELFILTYLCCWNIDFILVKVIPESKLLRAFGNEMNSCKILECNSFPNSFGSNNSCTVATGIVMQYKLFLSVDPKQSSGNVTKYLTFSRKFSTLGLHWDRKSVV